MTVVVSRVWTVPSTEIKHGVFYIYEAGEKDELSD